MEPLFILIIAGVIVLAKWFLKGGEQISESGEKKQTTYQPTRRPLADSEEERMRKFLEALGVPKGSALPRPITPRTDAPPRPLAPVRPPVVSFPELTRRSTTPKRAEQPRRTKSGETKPPPVPQAPKTKSPKFDAPLPSTEPPAWRESEPLSTEFPAAEIQPTPGAVRETQRDIRVLLKSNSGLRDSILLREILGPPRGLQSSGF